MVAAKFREKGVQPPQSAVAVTIRMAAIQQRAPTGPWMRRVKRIAYALDGHIINSYRQDIRQDVRQA